MSQQRYPLQWPVGYPRTQRPARSLFKNPTLGIAVLQVIHEINRLNGKVFNGSYAHIDTVISSNVPLRNDGLPRADYMRSQITDKGVAVYFKYNDKDIVMCCDKWDTVESNMRAIALSIESLRAIERWGVSDFITRSFTGFKALPAAPGSARSWYDVMGFTEPPRGFDHVLAHYKKMRIDLHPDKPGGSKEAFQDMLNAFEEAKKFYNVVGRF